MSDERERRFTDEQVREIFRIAARDPEEQAEEEDAALGGFTLAELQDIGQQVGLSPGSIARAARGIVPQGEVVERPTLAGVPVGVARTFALGRKVSQEEWERMVMSFRRTFRARGKTAAEGSLREWWNGNLRVTLEPTEHGDVMYFYTANSGTQALFRIGAAMTAMAAILFVILAVTGAGDASSAMTLLFIGLAQMGMGAIRLPAWLSRRARQFEELGDAAVKGKLAPGSPPKALEG